MVSVEEDRARLGANPVIGDACAVAALRRCDLFAAFSPSELVRVQQLAIARSVEAGEELYRESETVGSLFVLIAGHITVWREGQRIGEMEPGDPFGDLTLHGSRSSATARADVPTELLEFPLAGLDHLLKLDQALAFKLASSALARLGRRLHTMVDVVARYRRLFGDLSPEP